MKITKSFKLSDEAVMYLQQMAKNKDMSESAMLELMILECSKTLDYIRELQGEIEKKDNEIRALKDKLMSYDARLKEYDGKWKSLEASTKRVLDKFEETTNGLGDALESVVKMTSKQTAKKCFVYSLIVLAIVVILVIALVVVLRWL
ncbi:hypothetical protein [Hydrogenobaculum acidophilum]